MKHFRKSTLFVLTVCLAFHGLGQNNYIEKSPTLKNNTYHKNKSLYFDLLYNWNLKKVSEAGVETDGSFIYTTVWADDSIIAGKIYKYDMAGTVQDSFMIDSITGLRDLAYDGTFFYGGNDDHYIFKMNFASHTLVDTITCPSYVTVQSIAYDPVQNGFWVGGWNTDLWLVNASTGTVMDTIPFSVHGLIGMYGSAYDSISSGGPYLWFFDQNSSINQNDLVQVRISTGTKTGVIHDVTQDLAVNTGSVAGGLFSYFNSGTGKTTLGGLVQGSIVFGYDLSTMIVLSDAGVVKILTPNSSCDLTASETVSVVVKNFGFNPVSAFNISYKFNLFTNTETFSGTIAPFSLDTFTFTTPLNMSVAGLSDILYAYTTLGGDAFNSNDTAQKLLSHVAAVSPYYAMNFETDQEFEGWKALDLNNDGYTWKITNEKPYAGSFSAVYAYNPYMAANDWLFSKCINLKHDSDYVLSFYYRVHNNSFSEKLKIKFGPNQDTLDLDSTIADLGSVIDTVYKYYAKKFNVPADGIYYFGWNCYSIANQWNLYLDDVRITPGLLDVDEINFPSLLKVYPVPASDQIQFYCSDEISEIKILNLLGEQVFSKKTSGKNVTLPVYHLDQGIYFADITTAKGKLFRKIQIAR